MIYPLVCELADHNIAVTVTCRVLGISTSGYYDWLGRPASLREQANALLLKHIEEIHGKSHGTYGWPRVHADLVLDRGFSVNHKRIQRLMRQAGIHGIIRRKGHKNLVNQATAEDLVNRDFTVDAPNKLWVSDITEHQTREGKLYCAAVLDVYSRLIIGWSISSRLKKQIVLDALDMAVTRRRPEEKSTIYHSDHGSQYTSWEFGKTLRDSGLLGSMGTVGDCYDNAMMESFWSSMQVELLDRQQWDTREELATAIFEWIECWYNPYRRHSSLNYHSPITYEKLYKSTIDKHDESTIDKK
jgi:putative transposase